MPAQNLPTQACLLLLGLDLRLAHATIQENSSSVRVAPGACVDEGRQKMRVDGPRICTGVEQNFYNVIEAQFHRNYQRRITITVKRF